MIEVLFLTEGTQIPASRYRVHQWLPRLRRHGVNATVRALIPNKYAPGVGGLGYRWFELLKYWERIHQIRDVARFDVVYLQRDLLRGPSLELERKVLDRNPRIVFDVDDAQWLFSSREKIRWIVDRARHVIVGNRQIAAFCQPRETTVIPTLIDPQAYPTKESYRSDPIRIGWVGSSGSAGFFEGMGPVFRRVLIPGKVEMKIVSDGARIPDLEGLPVEYETWSSGRASSCFRDLDIGIMPLPRTELTQFKCGFKLIQYMACGIPSVASDVGANADILDARSGFLCGAPEEWTAALERLIGDEDLREQLGRGARQRAKNSFSLDAYEDTMIEILTGVAG